MCEGFEVEKRLLQLKCLRKYSRHDLQVAIFWHFKLCLVDRLKCLENFGNFSKTHLIECPCQGPGRARVLD